MAMYDVIREEAGRFAVQIRTEGKAETVGRFRTEQEANDWIAARPGSGTSDRDLEEGNAAQQLHRVETGDRDAARKIDHIRSTDPAAADAAEQEASDGPEGLGLAR